MPAALSQWVTLTPRLWLAVVTEYERRHHGAVVHHKCCQLSLFACHSSPVVADPELWIINTVGTHLLGWAERSNFDVDAVLTEAGLDRALFAPPARRIPVRATQALWGALAAQSEDPAFALRSGSAAIRGLVPVLGHYMGASRSIQDAFDAYMKHTTLFSNAITGEARTEEDEFVVRARWRDGVVTTTPQIAESVAAHWVAFPEHLAGQPLPPRRMTFPFPRPAHSDAHDELFGCPVSYDGNELVVCWGLEEATTAFQAYDPLVLAKLADALDHLKRAATGKLTSQVLSLLLTVDRPASHGTKEAANDLGVSPRTLQRRLSEEETSYRAILDHVLRQRTEEWLRIPSLSIDDVVWRLGYRNRSSFHRAFLRWNGVSPAAWRERGDAPR